jgi:hypothetical protein
MNGFHRLRQSGSNSAGDRPGRLRRQFRPQAEALDERLLLSVGFHAVEGAASRALHAAVASRMPAPAIAKANVQVIANAQQLVAQVFIGYNGDPIQIAQVRNLPDTYLVMLSGTDLFKPAQATSLPEDVAAEFGVPDPYYSAIKQAIRKHIPKVAQVILAGHSLGGMEAENVVTDHWLDQHYRFTHVITLGAPKTGTSINPNVTYTAFDLAGDPVTAITLFQWPPNSVYTLANPWEYDASTVFGHVEYPNSPLLDTFDALGQPNGAATLELGPITHVRAPANAVTELG